jgi:hypothetical protein
MTATFVNFGVKSLTGGGAFVQDENGNLNFPQWHKFSFFSNMYNLQNLYILMDFYLVF